jgi:hypothetical protein
MYEQQLLTCVIVLKTAAESYNPIFCAPRMGRRIPPKLLHYCERPIQIQYEFWKRANIINRDVIASLYGYAEEVIDIRACLENDDMGELMLRTWYVLGAFSHFYIC